MCYLVSSQVAMQRSGEGRWIHALTFTPFRPSMAYSYNRLINSVRLDVPSWLYGLRHFHLDMTLETGKELRTTHLRRRDEGRRGGGDEGRRGGEEGRGGGGRMRDTG